MNVANAPGEKIYPGELSKGLTLLKEGKNIDYVGAYKLSDRTGKLHPTM